jgi:aminopeptidase N
MKYFLYFSLLPILLVSCGQTAKSNLPYHFENYNLSVNIDPNQSTADVSALVNVKSEKSIREVSFLLNNQAKIKQVFVDDEEANFQSQTNFDLTKYFDNPDSTIENSYKNAMQVTVFLTEPEPETAINVNYILSAQDSVDEAAFSREYIAYEVRGYIGDKGVFLSPSFFWYPYLPENLANFSIEVSTPKNLTILTQGKKVFEEIDENTRMVKWEINYPADAIHLVGSNFEIKNAEFDDVSISTYFFPESQDLAPSYLQACQRYIPMYDKLIGPYPFSKFAVVENFFPTGYGMPSYTLLGSQVIRLPFIIYTSLGHEITHNWWGNSVYVDYESGNWCEGLTTYYADYHYKEMKSAEEAMQYRRDLDRDFTVYVTEKYDRPLAEFRERTESASRALGYGKSAMVFHQLRKIIGDSLFYQSFRNFYRDFKFKEASWKDIQNTVESTTGQDYAWFFEQWVYQKGAPKLVLKDVKTEDRQLDFTLQQLDGKYKLYIPVSVNYEGTEPTRTEIWLNQAQQTYQISLAGKPSSLAIDPDFDVFRKLDVNEIPPTLAEIFAKENTILVLPDNCSDSKLEAYKAFANTFSEGTEEKTVMKEPSEITNSELDSNSFYIIGSPEENSLWNSIDYSATQQLKVENNALQFEGRQVPAPEDMFIMMARAKHNPEIDYCFILLGKDENIGRVGMLLSHYGKYSYLMFSSGKNSMKGVFEAENSPLIYNF